MILTGEELIQAMQSDPRVMNGVDNANLMSVDSTEPVKTKAEVLDEGGKVVEGSAVMEDVKDLKAEDLGEVKADETKPVETEQIKPEQHESATVQERINKLTKKFRTAERERDFERAEKLELKKEIEALKAKLPAVGKPQKTDFETEEEFIEALTDWKIENKLNASQAKVVEEVKTKDEKEAVFAVYETLDTVMENGRKKYSDFDSLAFAEDLVLKPEVVQITLDTEVPEDVLYYLVSNPDESERISALGEVKAAKEIGKIEVKLLGKEKKGGDAESTKPIPPVKKQSNAPAPITPIVTTGSVDKDPANMSPKEYRAWREKRK